VVLVSVVLSLLLAASIPAFQGTAKRLEIERTAFALAQQLRYAHARAVTEGQTTLWMWVEAERCAQLEAIDESGVRSPMRGRGAQSRAVASTITIRLHQEDRPLESVSFFPDGTSESATLQVSRGDHAYQVTVDATTSQVRLETGPAAR